MSTFIVRFSTGYSSTRTILVDEDRLRVIFEDKTRVKKSRMSPIGRITEIESTGEIDRGRVRLLWRNGYTGDDGRQSLGTSGTTIRVLDAKDHVRRLPEEHAQQIAECDAEIEEHKNAIRNLRRHRVNLVTGAWRKAGPRSVSMTELEQRAEHWLTARQR